MVPEAATRLEVMKATHCFLIVACSCLLLNPTGSPAAPPKGQTSQEATIERAKKNLESPLAEKRVAALLVLSKYQVPESVNIFLKALKDPDGRVRLAAIVNLMESGAFNPTICLTALDKLSDENHDVRNIAALIISRGFFLIKEAIVRARISGKQELHESLKAKVRQGYLHEDVGVRRFFTRIDPKNFGDDDLLNKQDYLRLSKDEDAEVVGNAIELAKMKLFFDEFVAIFSDLVTHPDPAVRNTLLRATKARIEHPQVKKIVAQLAKDTDILVALEARLLLLKLDASRENKGLLLKSLLSPAISKGKKQRTLESLRGNQDHLSFLREIANTKSSMGDMAKISLLKSRDKQDAQLAYNLLFNNQKAPRDAALNYFYQTNHWHLEGEAFVMPLLESPWEDVLLFLSNPIIVRKMGKSLATEVLGDLFFNPSSKVRLNALKAMFLFKYGAWENFALGALEEGSPLSENSWRLILQSPQRTAILKKYIQKYPKGRYTDKARGQLGGS